MPCLASTLSSRGTPEDSVGLGLCALRPCFVRWFHDVLCDPSLRSRGNDNTLPALEAAPPRRGSKSCHAEELYAPGVEFALGKRLQMLSYSDLRPSLVSFFSILISSLKDLPSGLFRHDATCPSPCVLPSRILVLVVFLSNRSLEKLCFFCAVLCEAAAGSPRPPLQ